MELQQHFSRSSSSPPFGPATKQLYLDMIQYGSHANLTPRSTARTESTMGRSTDSTSARTETGTPTVVRKSSKIDSAPSPDIFSTLLIDHASAVLPLHETVSSGQSSGETRPTMGCRSYSRELLSTFLEQATTDEEVALAHEIKQTTTSTTSAVSTEQSFIIGKSLRKKKSKSARKDKKASSNNNRHSDFRQQEDWSEWRETNKTIDSLLQQSPLSLSTGSSTPRAGNDAFTGSHLASPGRRTPVTLVSGSSTAASPSQSRLVSGSFIIAPPSKIRSVSGSSTTLMSPSQTRDIKIDRDASSVRSDITGLTGVFAVCEKQQIGIDQTAVMEAKAVSSEKQQMVWDQATTMKARELSTKVPTEEALVATAQAQKKAKKKRTVQFETVFIRSYERILTSNPSCTSGPPVGLGWTYAPERGFKIDYFETYRVTRRRSHRQLLLPREIRERMLLELGYTPTELASAVRLSIRSKNQRKQTITNLRAAGIEEKLEKAGRKMKNLFIGRK